jgi:hypothetical protein
MNKENYTLVIQGKLHINTARMCNYHKDVNTVVSTWKSSIDPEEFLKDSLRPNLTIVVNDLPDVTNINNTANRYYQFMSSLYGMEAVKTKFAIKARSDEYYSNLDPLIEASAASPEKIVTNDVFFRKTKIYPYHPSDHLMAGKTEYMTTMFSDCANKCKDKVFSEVPEQQMGMMFIARRENGNDSHLDLPRGPNNYQKITQLMVKHFDVVSTSELGEFVIMYNGSNRNWRNSGYIDRQTDAFTTGSLATEL